MKLSHEYLASDERAATAGGRLDALVATDGELLMRFARHGDHQAFAQIVERHGGLVWVVCRHLLRHHQDVEDAFQATFFILAERADRIRNCDSAAAWLYKVAQRTSLAARRKRSRRREEELPAEPPQGDEALPILHDRQMVHVMMEELHDLPERYQVPLVLRYLEGQSRRAIADQTDSTIAQIQGRLVRGRRLLRSRMIRRGVSLSLAAGAMTSVSAKAGAAVTPALAVMTAKSCLALKTTGAAAGASAAAIQLAKQGAKAMWLTSIMKTTAAVSTVLVAAGIAWAVEAGGRSASGAASDAAAAPTVELQAVAAPVTPTAEAPTITIESETSRNAQRSITAAPPATAGVMITPEAQTVALPASDASVQIRDVITELQSVLLKQIDGKAEVTAGLELKQLEKSLLQRELEKQHEILIQLKLPAVADESVEAQRKPERIAMLGEQIKATKTELKYAMALAAEMSAELERGELIMTGRRQRLEDLKRMQTQLDFVPQANKQQTAEGASGAATASREASLQRSPIASEFTEVRADDKLEPRDSIFIRVANAYADAPIDSMFSVEPMGTVALGPQYGRVEVKGLTILEAEQAIKRHLSSLIEEPLVQVTLTSRRAIEKEVEQRYGVVQTLQSENELLKKEVERLKAEKARAPGPK